MKQCISTAFSIICALLFAPRAQAQWIPQCEGVLQANTWVEAMRVVDENVIWGTIDYVSVYIGADTVWLPRIARSVDGGQSWRIDSIPGTGGYLAFGLAAVSADTAWITMYNFNKPNHGRIYHTTDGIHWQQQYQEDSIAGLGIHFFDSKHGLIFRGNQVRLTSDGGSSWHAPASLPPAYNNSIFNYGGDCFAVWGNNIWFPLADGHLLKSGDRGNNWNLLSTPLVGDSVSFNCISFADANHGIALGIFTNTTYSTLLPSRLFRTEDGGNSWTEVPAANLPPMSISAAIEAIKGTSNTFIMSALDPATYSATDYITHNGGLNWEKLADPTSQAREVYGFASPTKGWSGNSFSFVPNDAMFFKWDGGALVGVPNVPDLSNALKQYPNPAHDQINVVIPPDITQGWELDVYDDSGHKVLASTSNTTLDIHRLPAGAYRSILKQGSSILGMARWVKL